MKILFCTHDLDSGGSARSLMVLISQLRENHDISILSIPPPNPQKNLASKYEQWKIPVFVFPWNFLQVAYSGLPYLPPYYDIPKDILNYIPHLKFWAAGMDCICFNGYASTSLAGILPREVPKFLIAREILLDNPPAIYRYLRGQIGRATAIGPAESRQLDEIGIPHSTVFNSPAIKPMFHPLPSGPIKIGIFSQFTMTKGIDVLAIAAKLIAPILRETGATIHLYGGSRNSTNKVEEKVGKFIATYDIGDILKFDGWCSNVEEAMLDCHFIVRPDISGSPWGRDIIEAMSVGRPVLATGTEDVFVKPGKTGWLVKPADPQALASGIRDILSAPDSINILAKNASEFAVANFDPEINAGKIEREIITLVNEKQA